MRTYRALGVLHPILKSSALRLTTSLMPPVILALVLPPVEDRRVRRREAVHRALLPQRQSQQALGPPLLIALCQLLSSMALGALRALSLLCSEAGI